jgi:hypothetical protein
MGRATRNALAEGKDALADGAAALAEPFRGMATRREPVELPPTARPPVPAGPPEPLVFPSGAGTSFTIGRQRDCDLYIADMSVSRLHARLARDAGGWLLTDLGSTNGTRLNGWRVRDAVPVRAGDQIQFGSAQFLVQGGDAPSG